MNQRLKLLISELKKRRIIYSQAEIAEKAGISTTQFSELVTGKRRLSERNIHKILKAFPEINENWMFTGEGEMMKKTSSATDHSVSIAGEEIRENTIQVNADNTIAMLVAEVAAQRRVTEKVIEQNSMLLDMLRLKVQNSEDAGDNK